MNTFKENKMQSRVSVHEHDITIYDQEFVHAINFNKDLASFQKVYDKHPKWFNREMIEYVIGIIENDITPRTPVSIEPPEWIARKNKLMDYDKEQQICKAIVEERKAIRNIIDEEIEAIDKAICSYQIESNKLRAKKSALQVVVAKLEVR